VVLAESAGFERFALGIYKDKSVHILLPKEQRPIISQVPNSGNDPTRGRGLPAAPSRRARDVSSNCFCKHKRSAQKTRPSPAANKKLKAFERPTRTNVAPRVELPLGHDRSAPFLVDFVRTLPERGTLPLRTEKWTPQTITTLRRSRHKSISRRAVSKVRSSAETKSNSRCSSLFNH
jgi:hypothetical protein